jgi:2-polyprenyl-3-methyl-5-hydroxy-6-metoxy-1,4-benzoquinol methylase
MSDQQEQTLQYFSEAAANWQAKSANSGSDYNVIEGRNRTVLATLDELAGVRRFLDVGCGTGQLVIAAAGRGIAAEGVDFAEDMIAWCEENARRAAVAAKFTKASFFETTFADGAYDAISAQGFIEYLSPDEMMEFFRRSQRMLRQGGALIVGSRNRLFNLHSLNEFTRMEASLGVLESLISESIALHGSSSQAAAFEALRKCERVDAQPTSHPHTGIEVSVRYQYAPADLTYRLRNCGYSPRTIYPVHFHGLPIEVIGERLELHREIAQLAADFGFRDQRLVPFSSSFVLDARKRD